MFLNKEMWREKCSSLHATDRILPLFCMYRKLLTKLHKILFGPGSSQSVSIATCYVLDSPATECWWGHSIATCYVLDSPATERWWEHSIATSYVQDSPATESWWGQDILHLSGLALEPTRPSIQLVLGYYWG